MRSCELVIFYTQRQCIEMRRPIPCYLLLSGSTSFSGVSVFPAITARISISAAMRSFLHAAQLTLLARSSLSLLPVSILDRSTPHRLDGVYTATFYVSYAECCAVAVVGNSGEFHIPLSCTVHPLSMCRRLFVILWLALICFIKVDGDAVSWTGGCVLSP